MPEVNIDRQSDWGKIVTRYNNKGLLCRDNETMYLELSEAPFPNSKIISGTNNQNAIANNVHENVLHVS